MSEPTWELLGGGGVVGGPIDYVGAWVAGTTYQPGQIVRYAGVDYLAVNPSVGQVPPLASPVPVGMVAIDEKILSAAAAAVTFDNIPSGYAHLKVMASYAQSGAGAGWVQGKLNNLSTNIYDSQLQYASAGTNTGTEIGGGTFAYIAYGYAQNGMFEWDILNYTSVNQKLMRTHWYGDWGGHTTGAAGRHVGHAGHLAALFAPVTRLDLTSLSTFLAGSRFTLYGLLAPGIAPPITTLAPGGIGTAFPSSPTNGELFTLVDSLTAPTYAWDFRYVASITDANKWVFVGGAPKIVMVDAIDAYSGMGWAVLATPGPNIVVPRVGDYHVSTGFAAKGPSGDFAHMSYDIGATAASAADAVRNQTGINAVGYNFQDAARTRFKSLPAVTLTAKYITAGGAWQIGHRWISLTPVRVS